MKAFALRWAVSTVELVLERTRRWPHLGALASSLASGLGTQLMLVGSGVIFARSLGPVDRGYLALLSLWPAVLWQLGSLGIQISASYYIAKRTANTVGIVYMLAKIGSAQVLILLALNAAIVLWYLHGRPSYLTFPAIISLGLLPPSLIRQYALGVLQGSRRFDAFNIGRALPSILTTAGALLLWATHRATLAAAIIVILVTSLLSAAVTLVVAKAVMKTSRSGESLPSNRQLVSFGLQSLPSSAYPVESFKLDQLFAGLALSPAALGVYVVASSFTNLPRFAAQSIGMVSYPNVAAQQSPAERRAFVWRFFWITLFIVTPIVIVLILAAGLLVPFFFGPQFNGAIPVAQILLAGGLFLGLRRTWFDGLRGAGYPLVGTLSEIASWIVLFVSMLTLAPRWNVVGVALAVLLSAITSLLLVLLAETILTRRGAWNKSVDLETAEAEAIL